MFVKLRTRLDVDRAIAFTFMARGVQMLGSTGTVLLIVHFLSPIQQGYYYTLLSMVALQVIFELGFTIVVLQMAAHETAYLTFGSEGRVEGDNKSRARLASLLQKTIVFYVTAGLLMGLILAPVGVHFFSRTAGRAANVAWQLPWAVALTMCILAFVQNPVISFLEGCGQVPQVAHTRLWQSVLGTVLAWIAMIAHHGLFSPGMVLAGNAIVGFLFLGSRRKLLIGLMRLPMESHSLWWFREVWPFQWRAAISYMSTYFTIQIFVPTLFAYRGAIEAGQMGMSMSITGYIGALTLSWMQTKAVPFGQFVVRGQYRQMDKLFFRTLTQSLAVLLTITVACITGVVALGHLYPKLAHRMVTPVLFGLLLLTGIANYVVQTEGIYLRSFKREPFVWQTLIVSALTAVTATAVAPRWGLKGVTVGYFLCSGIAGLTLATLVFLRSRRARAFSSLSPDRVGQVVGDCTRF